MTRKQKKSLCRILVSAGLLLAVWVLTSRSFYPQAWFAVLPLYLLPYLCVGYPVLKKAAVHIAHGQVFDENFLMSAATLGALAIGFFPEAKPQYAEAVFVMLFYEVGELFEGIAVGKSRASVAALMNIRPDTARVMRGGETLTVSPEEVAVGETVVVNPGEKLPLDGVVTEGVSSLDTVALTGESVPREVLPGDTVVGGCVNLTGVLRICVTKVYGESTVAKILETVESAGEKKTKSEHFITRFARWYTPTVVVSAVLLAVVPPLFDPAHAFSPWLFRALEFLVISCPCALVVSVPLSYFGGIGGASKSGILIKGSVHMEALARAGIVAFDKTGTVTRGTFRVTGIYPADGVSPDALVRIAALAESHSSHPVAVSLREAAGAVSGEVSDVTEVAGKGIRATVDGRAVSVGNEKLLADKTVAVTPSERVGTHVYVASDGAYLGEILISDEVKPEAKKAIGDLYRLGVRKTVMLTGDAEPIARAVAGEVGITEYRAGLLPGDKVDETEKLLLQKSGKETFVFVGDGINDAPVLGRADVGVAMGALGSDAAIEAADAVLMKDALSDLPRAIRICRKTVRIVKENIVFSLAVKAATLVLCAAVGIPMTVAVFADVGVLVLAVLNAMRALRA